MRTGGIKAEMKKGKVFAVLAAVCALVCALYSIVVNLADMNKFEDYTITIDTVLWWGVLLGFAVLLFLRKKNVGFLVVTGLAGLLEMYYFVRNLVAYIGYVHINVSFIVSSVVCNLLHIIVYVALFMLFLFNVVPLFKEKAQITNILCFIPAWLHLVAYGLQWYYMILNGTFSILADVWFDLFILAVVQTCMLLFAGLWLKETRVDTEYNKG